MGQTAVVITVAYAIALVLGSAIAFVIWRSTYRPDPKRTPHLVAPGDDVARDRRRRAVRAAPRDDLLVPYGESAGPGTQVVRVTGVQFAWAVNPTEVKAGRPVEFQMSTRDVNHGFGIYNPDGDRDPGAGHPRQDPEARVDVHRSRTYEVRCLEFCGNKHHELLGLGRG